MDTTNNPKAQPSSTLQSETSFTRFTRTVTDQAKSYFSQQSAGNSHPDTSDGSQSSKPNTKPSMPQGDVAKGPTAFERFMNLGRTKKNWEIDFPPSHWMEGGSGTPAPNPSDVPAQDSDVSYNEKEQRLENESSEPPPEPATLAKRIQSMLAAIPPVFTPDGPSDGSTKGPPAPPQLVSDPKMVSFLSSPAVMNGEASKGGQSVWSALDHLRAVLPGQQKLSADRQSGTPDRSSKGGEVLDDDESGVMVYAPLFPTDGSQVELAKSEMVSDTSAEESRSTMPAKTSDTLTDKLGNMWPFGKGKATGETSESASEPVGASTSRLHFHDGKSKRVWVPSPDQISVQVMWWGYRIYLPPPVLEVLDDKQLEGAKRAALLTTALKWALDRVPLVILPPQARPAMRMFKAFTPYLGYVGSFVAWSWGAVKSFDKGNGVTLTATWLLTVAVIPGTWEDKDFPAPVVQTATSEAATHEKQHETPSSLPQA